MLKEQKLIIDSIEKSRYRLNNNYQQKQYNLGKNKSYI